MPRLRRRPSTAFLVPGFVALVLGALGGCGHTSATATPSPRPAVSLSALPGLAVADRAQDPDAYRAVQSRVVEVYVLPSARPAALHAMARRIAAMPEVVAYHFVNEREALERFFRQTGQQETSLAPPPYFEILVRERSQLRAVTARFLHDRLVDNDPGTTDGVVLPSLTP